MDSDALVTSLIARVRSLEDILDGMDDRIERSKDLAVSAQAQAEQAAAQARAAAAAEEILRRALPTGEAYQGPRHAAARRDRHGLRMIPGGLAAFAPVAFLAAHGLPAVTLAGVRLWLRTERGRWIASALLFGLAGAIAVPAGAVPDLARAGVPHPHAIVTAHRHHRRTRWQIPAIPPVPPVAVHHASHHHHQAGNGARPTPSPSPTDAGSPTPTDEPTPAPSASATGTGAPSPEPSESDN